MKRERQVLLTDVFPRLARLSAKLSMHFEMVDLSLDDSPRRKVLAQHHIRDAVKESAGTSFMVCTLHIKDESGNRVHGA